jgi:para-nitrobenzyl esterase
MIMKSRLWMVPSAVGLTTVLGCSSVTAAQMAASRDVTGGQVVRIDSGLVRGVADSQTRTFSGIPYAAPPTGPLRWKSPQPVHRWSNVLEATKPGNVCMQPDYDMPKGGKQSEDCLNLNVTAPSDASPRHLKPVIVWIHGGDLTNGSGRMWNPKRMVTQGDVVVVTINYRLGIFGFFGHRGLPGSGTFGLQDQQAALRWVGRNAAAFGGDARNVTLDGESAGAASTCAQFTSPAARGLFAKAILQSVGCQTFGTAVFPGNPKDPTTLPAAYKFQALGASQAQGAQAASALGCEQQPDVLACMRGKDSTVFTSAEYLPLNMSFAKPAYGTPTLPQNPVSALKKGTFTHVPVLIGHTHDEDRFMMNSVINPGAGGRPIDAARWQALTDLFTDRAGAVRAMYRPSAYDKQVPAGVPGADRANMDRALAWAAIETDRSFACAIWRDGDAIAAHAPAYGYEFADPNATPYTTLVPGFPSGAAHISDLFPLFDVDQEYPAIDPRTGKPYEFTSAQQKLATTMIGYWTTFARTGDPNTAGAPHWAPYRSGARVQSLAPTRIGPVNDLTEHHCGFWNN